MTYLTPDAIPASETQKEKTIAAMVKERIIRNYWMRFL